MISEEKYKKIITQGERVDWYGVEVPLELLTPTVKFVSDNLLHEINKLESTLNDLNGKSYDKRKAYIESLKTNLKNMPHTLNGDVYLIKKKRYETEINVKHNKGKTRKKTTTVKKVSSSKTTTKNGNLIFGKNKK